MGRRTDERTGKSGFLPIHSIFKGKEGGGGEIWDTVVSK